MLLNNPMHGGQPHSSAFKFRVGVEALEYAEEFFSILHIEAFAVIAPENDCRLSGCWMPRFDQPPHAGFCFGFLHGAE